MATPIPSPLNLRKPMDCEICPEVVFAVDMQCKPSSLTIQMGTNVETVTLQCCVFFTWTWYAFVLTWSTFYTTGIKVNEIILGPQPLELI